jgi:hypothetical protein
MPGEITLVQAKKLFWENVVSPPNVRRAVCKVLVWGDYSNGGQDYGDYKLFFPTSWDDDYDMVTTLGDNGWTYPIYDLDTPGAYTKHTESFKSLVAPSSTNWHSYDNWPTKWSEYCERLKVVNEPYWVMNASKGWAGLRAPWIAKNGIAPTRWKNPDNWINFNKSDLESYLEPEEPQGVSLADLFGDES